MTTPWKYVWPFAALALSVVSVPAFASDSSDVAREMQVPASVADNVFVNVDAFMAAAEAPGNRLMSGVIKQVALRAIKDRIANLDDSGPGKASDASSDEAHAVYKASVRTTRRDSTEAGECVGNRVSLTGSEALPIVKDGHFTFDTTHPRVTSYSWDLTFCRNATSGGDYTDWVLK